MAVDLKVARRRYRLAKDELQAFSPVMQEVYRYCIPNRDNWTTISKGSRNDKEVFNSHPVNATKKFASNILNLIAPNGLKFFKLTSSKNFDNDNDKENFEKLMQGVSDKLFAFLESSSFYTACHEAMIDLAAGTGAMIVRYSGDDSNPLAFTSLSQANLAFTESSNGIINNVFQEVTDMDIDTARALYPLAVFPDDKDKVSFIIACIYDEHPDKKGEPRFKYYLTNKEFSETYFENAYDTNPYIVFRWGKLSGENRGRGILMDMLGSIKTANIMAYDILQNAEQAISAPLFVESNSMINPNRVDMSPRGVNFYKPNIKTGGLPVYRLPPSPGLQFGLEQIHELNVELDSAMMIDILGQVGTNQQTATEVEARLQIAANILASAFGRLQNELLAPVINRCLDIMVAIGKIPVLPNHLKIKYESPIVALQTKQDVNTMLQVIQALATITGQQAAAIISASIDIPALPQWIASKLGADNRLINATDDIRAALEKAAQELADQAKHQQDMANMQNNGANSALGTNPVNTGLPGVQSA